MYTKGEIVICRTNFVRIALPATAPPTLMNINEIYFGAWKMWINWNLNNADNIHYYIRWKANKTTFSTPQMKRVALEANAKHAVRRRGHLQRTNMNIGT